MVVNCSMRMHKENIDLGKSDNSKVDLNNLIKRVKEEEKKSRRTNVAVSAAAISAIAVFGIILTL